MRLSTKKKKKKDFGIGMSVDYRHHCHVQKGSVEMILTHASSAIRTAPSDGKARRR